MTLVKFNKRPFDRSLDNFFDNFFNEAPAAVKNDFNHSGWNHFAPVNIKETKDSYNLEVVAPGFEKTDFKIKQDGDMITISAEKKEEVKNENEKSIRKEYSYRSFKRSFTIDEKIDAGNIEAKYVNGVLTLNLPKKETVKEAEKEISIN